jgi:putative transposase
MPEHIHLFVCGPDNFVLGRWIGSLKQALTKSITCGRGGRPIWQRVSLITFCETMKSYSQKWDYVRENPVRAGLVANVDDWPYSGEIVIIDRA